MFFFLLKCISQSKKLWTTSTNWFLTMKIMILMNMYIGICINGPGQVNAFVLVC